MDNITPVASKLIRGAAIEFTERELGGPVVENESFVTIGTSATVAAEGAGDRVALILVNQGATDMFVGTRPDISATQGIRLTANGGSLILTVRDDFTLSTRRWYAFALTAPEVLYVMELIRFTTTDKAQV